LVEKGVSVTVLEAEDRIGGRIYTVPHSSGFVDLGGQWCHGQTGNSIYDFVSPYFKFGDTGFDNTDETFVLSNGLPANQNQCNKLRSLYETIMENSYAEMELYPGSLGDFYVMKYKKAMLTSTYSTIPVELQNQFLEFSHKDTNGLYGSSNWTQISAKLDALSGSVGGNQYLTWGTKGFKTVFDYISVINIFI
jgi:spermine oxidase